MDETRAVARLPHLDIEVTHRRLDEEEAEQLTVSVRAVPSFNAFGRWLELHPSWPLLALSPFAAWQRAMLGFWSPMRMGWPWLMIAPARSIEPQSGERLPPGGSGSSARTRLADPKVHPFPGPDERGG